MDQSDLVTSLQARAPVMVGIDRTVPTRSTLVWVAPTGPGGRYRSSLCGPPRHHPRAVSDPVEISLSQGVVHTSI
jgi:hypothetical protein